MKLALPFLRWRTADAIAPAARSILACVVYSLLTGAAAAVAQTSPAAPQQAPAMTAPAPALHAFDPTLRDTTVDPCSDFYQYACGGWLRRNAIPADRASYGRDTEVEDANEQSLRRILEQAAGKPPATRSANEQKIGDAYAACMDTDAINRAGTAPVLAALAVVDQVQSLKDLPGVLARLHVAGVAGFFVFGAQQDFRDATRQIALVAQPRLGLPEKGYYDRTDSKTAQLRQEYVDHIRRSFLLLGEPDSASISDANTVLRIETKLADASLSQVDMRDPAKLYHKTPLVQFEANSPELVFESYLKAIDAPPVQVLNVAEPVYFLELHEVLTTASLADIRTFLRWSTLRVLRGTALPQPLDDEAFAFYSKVLSGIPQQQPRWKRCTETVDTELGEALGEVYVGEQFTPATKARAETLTRSVEGAADEDIDRLPWMGVSTKAEAKHKLHLIANNIGYPEKWRDYTALLIKRDDAFGNAQRATAFDVARRTRKIGQPVDRGEWIMTPPTVNAYYDPQLNSINFPAGILQPPYFDPTEDDAVNYGAAGGVIGHELTHGFDDEGRQFDGQGNMRDWWSKDDARQFADRADCVASEYSSFVAVQEADGAPLHVNGKLTLGEDLADLAGLRLAFLAYSGDAKQAGVALDKGGDAAYGGLTPAQQFFTAYGQSWCENTRVEAVRQDVEINPHAPEKYRVNGVVQNMPAFADAFQCKASAPMVAAKRCSLW